VKGDIKWEGGEIDYLRGHLFALGRGSWNPRGIRRTGREKKDLIWLNRICFRRGDAFGNLGKLNSSISLIGRWRPECFRREGKLVQPQRGKETEVC